MLIAGSYVLHRLLAPRHPPNALSRLTTKIFALECSSSNLSSKLTTASTTISHRAGHLEPQKAPSRGLSTASWRVDARLDPRCQRAKGRDSGALPEPLGPIFQNQVAALVIHYASGWSCPKATIVGSLKEVIQPQVPLRLPCYDFTPIIDQTVGASLLAVGSTTSGPANFRGVTGGVYKARERIHRGMLIRDY